MSAFQLLGRPRSGKRRASDRRGAVRFAPAQEIVCHCLIAEADLCCRARVCDISAGGACLLLRYPLEVGDCVRVELVNGPHTFLCARTLRVLRVFSGSGEEAVIAGEFDRPLGYEELLPFIV